MANQLLLFHSKCPSHLSSCRSSSLIDSGLLARTMVSVCSRSSSHATCGQFGLLPTMMLCHGPNGHAAACRSSNLSLRQVECSSPCCNNSWTTQLVHAINALLLTKMPAKMPLQHHGYGTSPLPMLMATSSNTKATTMHLGLEAGVLLTPQHTMSMALPVCHGCGSPHGSALSQSFPCPLG